MRHSFAIFTLAIAVVPRPGHADSAPPAIDGVWAMRLVTTAVSRVPVIGRLQTESRYYARGTLTEHDGTLSLTMQPCRVTTDRTAGARPVIGPKLLAVMGPPHRTGSRTGDRVTFGRAVDVLGAKLDDEWNDPLPTSADDATVLDEDRDGKPGVTVGIRGIIDGEVYVAQRSWNSLTGVITPDGTRIDGTIQWHTEQSLLGASSVFLKVNPRAERHPSEKNHHFSMVKVSPSTTCAALAARGDAPFQAQD